jgi:Domain of unknown function (DUF4383)
MTTLRVARAARVRTPIQGVTTAVGAAFLALGILGFVPEVVSDYDTLAFAVHVAFGVAGLALARTTMASAYLLCGGASYLVLWVYGVVDSADDWLHLVIAAVMIGLGLALEPAGRRAP